MPEVIGTIVVSTNTSLVLLDTENISTNSTLVVLLSSVSIPGRIATIRDSTGFLTSNRTITVSTTKGISFIDGTNTVTLAAPYSFATFGNTDPYTWVLQNTFGFPIEGSAANVLGITARYLYTSSAQITATLSSANLNVSTITVGTTNATSNLFANGDVYIGSLTDRFTDFGGNAALQKSLLVAGPISTAQSLTASTLIIAGQTTIGKELFVGSTLTVVANATFNSTVQSFLFTTLSSATIGTSLSVGNLLSTPSVLVSTLTVANLLQTSNTVVTGGAVLSSLSTVGRIGFGADLFMTANNLLVRNVATVGLGTTALSTITLTASTATLGSLLVTTGLSSLTSFGLGADLLMTNNNIVASNISTQTASISTLFIATSLQVPQILISTLTASNTITVGTSILTTTSLSTQTVIATQGTFSTLSGEGSGIFNLNALSTSQLTSTVRGLGNIYLSTSFIDLLVNFSTVSTNYYLASCNAVINKISYVNVASLDNFPTYYLAYSSNAYLYSNANPLVTATWTNRAILRAANKISWNGKIWLAACPVVSVNDSLKWSTDGINWFPPTSGGLFGNASNVIWGNTPSGGFKWVACGLDSYTEYANIQYSADGKNWGTAFNNGVAFNIGLDQGATVIANNGTAWLAGGVYNGTTSLFTSADGVVWSNVVGNIDAVGVTEIGWNGTYWLLAGREPNKLRITYDPTGVSGWTTISSITGTFDTIAWNGKYWFIAGSNYSGYSYSLDARNWLNVSMDSRSIRSLLWTGTFLAATTNSNGIYISRDGITNWTPQTTGSNLFFSGIAFTSNVNPAYQQTNLEIIYDNQDNYFNTANKIFTFPSSLLVNDTFIVDRGFRRAGINCNSPRYTLDIAGSLNASSLYLGISPPIPLSSMMDTSAPASTLYTLEVNGTTKLSTLLTASLLTNSLEIATALNSVNPVLSLNNTVYVNSITNTAGVNCNSPSYPLDVNGMANFSSIKSVVIAPPPIIAATGVYNYIKPIGGTTSTFNVSLSTFSTLGQTAYLMGSPDGMNWSPILGTSSFTNVFSIQYNGSIWVLCCSNGPLNLYSSSDGSNWNPAPAGQHFTTSYYLNQYGAAYDAAWNGSNWVAVGTGYRQTTVKVSADGLNWSNSSNAPFNYSNDGGYASAITYGNGMFVASAVNPGSAFAPFLYSSDGYNWNIPASTDGSVALGVGTAFKPLWDSTNWYIQYNGSIVKSTDAINWSSNSVATPPERQLTGISYNGTVYVASSYSNSAISLQYATQISTSSWNTVTTPQHFNSVAARPIWDGTYWYVAGSNSTDPLYGNKDLLLKSPDGITWSLTLTNPYTTPSATSPPLIANSWLSTFTAQSLPPSLNVPGLSIYSRAIPLINQYSTFNTLNLYSTGMQFNSTVTIFNSQKLMDVQGTILTKSLSSGVINASSILLMGIPFSFFLLSTVAGLPTFGYVNVSSLISTVTSTNIGLATYGYVSSTQLTSTVAGLGNANYVSSSQLLSTVAGLGNINYVSTSQLTSTVMGLGTSRYISSSQLISSIQGLEIYISSSIGNSGTNTFGAVFYLNYSASVPPYSGLQTTTIAASQVILSNVVTANSASFVAAFQTDYTLSPFIPPGIWDLNLFADSDIGNTYTYISLYTRLAGVETLVTTTSVYPTDMYGPTGVASQYSLTFPVPYTSTPPGTTIVLKLYASNAGGTTANFRTYFEGTAYSHIHTTFGAVVPADSLTSTVAGLGNSSYISSPQLISTVLGLGRAGYISSTQLASTVMGLGTANYVSSTQLASTVVGLGTMGYVSSANLLNLVSTANLLNLVSTANLGGLVSTSHLGQSLSTLSTTYSQNFFTSSLRASTIVACNAVISSITVNSLTVGSGDGYIAMGDVVMTSLSTIQVNTNVLITSSIFATNLLGLVSTANLTNLVSTANLINLVSTANLGGLVSTANLLNLVSTSLLGQSLSTLSTGYSQNFYTTLANISSLLVSSIRSSNAYVSTLTVDSLNIGANAGYLVTGDIIATSLSTIQVNTGILNATTLNVASLTGLVSTANLINHVSTANLLNLVSTSYLATQLAGVTGGLTLQIGTSSISSSYITSVQGYISSLTVDSLAITSNAGYVNMGDIIATFLSTPVLTTGNATITQLTVSSYTANFGFLSSFRTLIASTSQLITSSLSVSGGIPNMTVSALIASSITTTGNVGINSNTPQYTLDVNGSVNASTLLVNGATRTPQFSLDVNGTSRSAIFYSSVTAGGTMTLTLSNYFGVYYNITTSGTYTINVPSTQPASNIGKYYVIRNNTGNDASATFTGGLGITSPITLFSNASATVVAISTNGYYALF